MAVIVLGADENTIQAIPSAMLEAVFGESQGSIIATPPDTIILDPDDDPFTITVPSPDVIVTSSQGPTGPAGRDGAATGLIARSTIAISGHKVVSTPLTDVEYASSDDLSFLGRVLGVTTNAASPGDDITVITAGDVEEPTWNWSLGVVYLGVNGVLTQTPPTSGFIQQIGIALAATKLLVAIRQPIVLN